MFTQFLNAKLLLHVKLFKHIIYLLSLFKRAIYLDIFVFFLVRVSLTNTSRVIFSWRSTIFCCFFFPGSNFCCQICQQVRLILKNHFSELQHVSHACWPHVASSNGPRANGEEFCSCCDGLCPCALAFI